ncbi:MAG: oligosaccharide flippase family protein [Chloroflexaceae bacterium]|nr:oligosaccharide flippase family protein [Chloroflexaceae bacterium]
MNLIARFARQKIIKNTSSLAVGQFVGRVLTVIYVAALARYVGSEGIGQISIATTINGLLVLLVGPGLEVLLTRDVSADRDKSSMYLGNTLLMRLFLGAPFLLMVIVISHFAGYSADTMAIVYVYTVVYLLDALGELLSATFQAYEHMEFVGGAEVMRNLINVILSLLGIYLGWSLFAIALMSVVASVCKLLFLGVVMHWRFVRPSFSFNPQFWQTLFIASLPFGLLLILHTGQALFGTFVISLFYPEEMVGLYNAANMLIIMVLMLPSAFAKAIFPSFSHLYVHNRDALPSFYQVCYKFLVILGFPLGLGTILVGEQVIVLVYGEEFTQAAVILYILAMFLFTIVGYSNGSLLNATGMQNFFAWTEAVAVAVNVLGSIVLVPFVGPTGAAISLVASGVGTFYVHSRAAHTQLGLAIPWLMMLKVALATAVMGAIVWIGIWYHVPWLLLVFPVAPIVYLLALSLAGLISREELKLLASGTSLQTEETVATTEEAGRTTEETALT